MPIFEEYGAFKKESGLIHVSRIKQKCVPDKYILYNRGKVYKCKKFLKAVVHVLIIDQRSQLCVRRNPGNGIHSRAIHAAVTSECCL